MRLPKFRSVLLAAAILGVSVPAGFFVARHFGHFFGTTLDLCLWPTSIILMATEMHGNDLFAKGLLAMSIFGNVLYYLFLLTFLWSIGWVFRAWRASLRDGTTI
jgi:hypothetical protein